ncbi:proline dehydrogenase family protein [soil metagenome]
MGWFTKVVLATTEAAPVEKVVTGTRAGRALAGRFVAGDTLDEGAAAAHELNSNGLEVSLDLLGEDVSDRDGAEAATVEYLKSLDRIAADGLAANISVKLTQLGLSIGPEVAADALDRLAAAAAQAGTTVTVDMEDSRYTHDTVEMYARVQPRHGNLGLCLQAYLHRTPDDLERLVSLGGHLRLCKGAYAENDDVAFTNDHEVDAAFARLLTVLMQAETVRPAVATHDPKLIDLTLRLAGKRAAPFEFQMLYGIRRAEQRRLVAAGHELRVYLPFGSAWYPYLTRRLAERPANVAFFLRSFLPTSR